METEHILRVLKHVANVAALAGLRGEIVDGFFEITFETEAGKRVALVRPCAATRNDNIIVRVFCYAWAMTAATFPTLSKEQALELLTMNEQLTFARFGILEAEHGSVVIASCDLILETMIPTELYWRVQSVAVAADRCEDALRGDI